MATNSNQLDRREAVPALLGDLSGKLVVSGLAGPAQDLGAHTQETDNVFLLGGAMGAAVSMALGLALSRPEKQVLVATGDGDLLMNVGALSVVGAMQPPNLSIVCIDNGAYGETGYQPSHTSRGVDLETIAKGSGIAATMTVNSMEDMPAAQAVLAREDTPSFVLLRVSTDPSARYKRSFDARARKTIFRDALA